MRRSSESPIVPAKQEDYEDDRYRNYQQRRPSDLGYEVISFLYLISQRILTKLCKNIP